MELEIVKGKLIRYSGNEKCVVLPDSVESIGGAAFVRLNAGVPRGKTNVSADSGEGMEEIRLPETLKVINTGAFIGCKKLKKVVIAESCSPLICDYAFRDCPELADENGFIIVNRALVDYAGKAKEVQIPDGVDTICNHIFTQLLFRKVYFPKSIKWVVVEDVRLPIDYLQQKEKVNVDLVVHQINIAWKFFARDKDYAALQLFQTSKKIQETIAPYVNKNPDATLQLMCELLEEKGSASHYQKAADYLFAHKTAVRQESIDRLYDLAVNAKAKKTVELLTPYTSKNAEMNETQIVPADVKDPIELFCSEHFVPYAIEKSMKKAGISSSILSTIRYKHSDVTASPFVVGCALAPYVDQLKDIPKRIGDYKTNYSRFEIVPDADTVAESLDKGSLCAALGILLGDHLPTTKSILVPYGRYASGKQIAALNTRLKEWAKWDTYAAIGRSAIIIAHGAMLLNDTREALMLADKLGLLDAAARIRNTTADVLRDTVISDFSFDADGKKKYDLGGTTVEVSLRDDLALQIVDLKTGKSIKAVPKKGNEERKVALAAAEIADTKKNIKKAISNRVDTLKKEFVSNDSHRAEDWIKSYLNNPVIRQIGRLVVWQCNDKMSGTSFSFMLKEDGSFIASDGKTVKIPNDAQIAVAHPLTMDPSELFRWRTYLRENSIAQPFTQIFEPVYSVDLTAVVKRYSGIRLPFFLVKKLEKEGFEIYGDAENGFGARLRYGGIRIGFFLNSPSRIYSPKMIPVKEEVTLGTMSITTKKMTKLLNHVLYTMDGLSIQSVIQSNRVDMLVMQEEHLTEKNILPLIDAAQEAGSTDCLLWLMNYKNEHFPYAMEDLSL